ncbi:MAG TPA: DNA mismatch repair protein MutS [Candidatus Ozemobacteraceae bacterium]|nr:DNA mismatch repair protein MutS [Candidatus Ozemobacteraceae bacterium]
MSASASTDHAMNVDPELSGKNAVVAEPSQPPADTSAGGATEDKGLTPLLQQYVDLKAENPNALLLFRCGDFYETFFEDAVVAARELQITLTARGKSGGNPVPLAGVPYHSAMTYIARLVQKGFTVAICEQMEDPKLAKGLVKREIVRIITPGTISDPQLLEEKSNNWLMAFGKRGDRFCLAGAELSTGEVIVTGGDVAEMAKIREELTRLAPREILVLGGETGEQEAPAAAPASAEPMPWKGLPIEVLSRKMGEQPALEAMTRLYPSEPRPRFLAMPGIELRTLGLLADYLLDTQKCTLSHLRFPAPYRLGDGMVLDESTLRNLELMPDGRDRSPGGTLFEVLNRTRTSMGARLLKRWLLKPLLQLEPIRERQDRIAALVEDGMLLATLREQLRDIPDLERLLSKIILGSRNPRDVQALCRGIEALPALHERISASSISALAPELEPIPDLARLLKTSLLENLPMSLADGGVIADGVDPALDELRRLRRDGDSWLTEYEEREKNQTGIKTLKVRKNSVFGYFIEISKGLTDKAPAHYVRKQTLTNGERYITAELKDYETKVFSAVEKSVAIEKDLFEKLVAAVREHIASIQRAAAGIAHVDTLCSLAQLARERGYVRPTLVEEPILRIREGRHPVVEAFLGAGEFHPNDSTFDATRRQAVITGPNMAGKSTYLRQNALIVLLAQIGSFVPAREAEIGLVDRIFTRVGASDNLIRGQSTFMVEMMEAASILRHATPKSLLILDEIGRGTSTFDGLSLAWSILEYIQRQLGARTLFATHYHELTDLQPILDGVFNLNVGVLHDEKTGDMVFLHQIHEGPSSKSYGIEVARLAGVPSPVIDRAREILFELEKTEEDEVGRMTRAVRTVKAPKPQQLSLFTPSNELAETIQAINIENTTPLEALNLLARLKKLANG